MAAEEASAILAPPMPELAFASAGASSGAGEAVHTSPEMRSYAAFRLLGSKLALCAAPIVADQPIGGLKRPRLADLRRSGTKWDMAGNAKCLQLRFEAVGGEE